MGPATILAIIILVVAILILIFYYLQSTNNPVYQKRPGRPFRGSYGFITLSGTFIF